MAKFDTKQIRNIALLGHGGCGKTSLAEAMLYIAGETDRLGKVTDGNTVCDYDPEEIARGFSLSSSIANFVWKDAKINLIDTPGHADFGGEVERILKMVNGVILLVDAAEGPMPQTRFVLQRALELNHKVIVVVNKIDRPGARPAEVIDEVLKSYPFAAHHALEGVIVLKCNLYTVHWNIFKYN